MRDGLAGWQGGGVALVASNVRDKKQALVIHTAGYTKQSGR